MNGSDIYRMVAGLGTSFTEGYDRSRKRSLEDLQFQSTRDAAQAMLAAGGGDAPATLGSLGQPSPAAPAPAPRAPAAPSMGMGMTGGPARRMAMPVDDVMKAKLVEAATAAGVDPVDLATVISYETGGTFNPTQAGPRTQWGQHRGLIQFGEPQAKQHGVDWNNPVETQLGANGAVVKYLKSAGVQPGMGLLDLYSAVNAGRVGRYNASDANNGGAPGTVRDKVEKQMAGHRARALAMFGGQAGGAPAARPGAVASADGPPDQTGLSDRERTQLTWAEQRALQEQRGRTASADLPAAGAAPTSMGPGGFTVPGNVPSAPRSAPVAPVAAPGAPVASPQAQAAPGASAGLMRGVPAPIQAMLRSQNPYTVEQGMKLAAPYLKPQDPPNLTPIDLGGGRRGLLNPRTGAISPIPGTGDEYETLTDPDGTIRQRHMTTGEMKVVRPGDKPMAVSPGSTVIDPGTGRAIYSAPQAPAKPELKELNGRLVLVDVAGGKASDITPQGMPSAYRPMTKEERVALGMPGETGGYIGPDGKPGALPGTARTTVDFGAKSQGKFLETMAGEQGKRWSGYITAAEEAQNKLADIQTLRDASEALGSQGKAADLKAAVGPYAEMLGIEVAGLKDIQVYDSLVKRLAPQLRAPGSGSTSDIEYKGFVAAIGPLSNNPEARKAIFDTFEAAAQHDLLKGDIARRLEVGEIDRGQAEREIRELPHPMEAFRKFRRENAALVGSAMSQGRAGGQAPAGSPDIRTGDNVAPVRVQTPEEAAKLAPGTRFVTPDGRLKIR